MTWYYKFEKEKFKVLSSRCFHVQSGHWIFGSENNFDSDLFDVFNSQIDI